MKKITKKAYGKVNLFLSVGEIRDDNKHNVETVMHKISAHDTVTVWRTENEGIEVSCDIPALSVGRDNLVYKACKEYEKAMGKPVSVRAHIEKRIPIAGGMGGGSSDCAATLLALNELYGALSFEALVDIASSLGSDIPFFLYGDRAMIGRGTGEKMTPCASVSSDMYGVFVMGGHKQSTGAMYASLDAKRAEMKLFGRVLSSKNIVCALENGDALQILEEIQNDFEICSEGFEKSKTELEALGSDKVFLCGSGPTVCGIFLEKEKAERASLGLGEKSFLAKIE